MPPVIPQILAQHAADAAFLWLLRDDAASREPHYLLGDLAELDARLDANLDGLRFAGADGWDYCIAEYTWQEPGEIFAATVLALDGGARDRIDHVLEVGTTAAEFERGLVSALGWSAAPAVPALIADLSRSSDPARRRLAVGALAIRREYPGRWLNDAFRDADAGVRARALRAAGELGRVDDAYDVRQGANDEDPACRYWSAWSAARLGDRSLAVGQAVRDVALQPGPFQARAVAMAVRIMPADEVYNWLRPCWKDEKTLRLAATGIAASGDPQFVPVLLQMMQVNEAARPAGEAFSVITGADLAYLDLDRDRPEGFQSGPTEDPADENVAMDADENLPWPDPVLVERWWQANRSRFTPGVRYLCGREITRATLVQTLNDGYQRQRAAAALELALVEPSRPMFEVRARGDWQQRLLPLWYPAS